MPPVMAITDAGENKAWELLAASDPATVSRAGRGRLRSRLTARYRVPSFGRHFTVHPGERRILGREPGGEAFLKRDVSTSSGSRCSGTWSRRPPARPSGTLVNPAALPGGDIFLKGTHVLPLDALAANYATRPEAFLAAGAALGGNPGRVRRRRGRALPAAEGAGDGDSSGPRTTNSRRGPTCSSTRRARSHLPLDILWSVAMMSVLPLL